MISVEKVTDSSPYLLLLAEGQELEWRRCSGQKYLRDLRRPLAPSNLILCTQIILFNHQRQSRMVLWNYEQIAHNVIALSKKTHVKEVGSTEEQGFVLSRML